MKLCWWCGKGLIDNEGESFLTPDENEVKVHKVCLGAATTEFYMNFREAENERRNGQDTLPIRQLQI